MFTCEFYAPIHVYALVTCARVCVCGVAWMVDEQDNVRIDSITPPGECYLMHTIDSKIFHCKEWVAGFEVCRGQQRLLPTAGI